MSKPFYNPLKDDLSKALKTLINQTSKEEISYKSIFSTYPAVMDLAGIGSNEYYRKAVLVKFHRHIKPSSKTGYIVGDISGDSDDRVPYVALPDVFKLLLDDDVSKKSSKDLDGFISDSQAVVSKVDTLYSRYKADHSQRPSLGVRMIRKMMNDMQNR